MVGAGVGAVDPGTYVETVGATGEAVVELGAEDVAVELEVVELPVV